MFCSSVISTQWFFVFDPGRVICEVFPSHDTLAVTRPSLIQMQMSQSHGEKRKKGDGELPIKLLLHRPSMHRCFVLKVC